MKFINDLAASLYSPSFYTKVMKQPVGQAIKHFALAAIVMTVIVAASASSAIMTAWDFQGNLGKYSDLVIGRFPKDLVVTLKHGTISTNMPEPYKIPLDDSMTKDSKIKNAVVIDTKTPFSAEQFAAYQTAVWVHHDRIYYSDGEPSTPGGRAEIKSSDLADAPDTVIDRAMVESKVKGFLPIVKALLPIFGLIIVAFIYGFMFSKLIYLAILALVIMLLYKMANRPTTYAQSYIVGLYAGVPVFILTTAMGALHIPSIVFLPSAVILCLVVANTMRTPRQT